MRVLAPLPDRDFDPTEVAVPWSGLSEAGHEVVFSTERGGPPPECDPRLLAGVLFGRFGAEPAAIETYRRMSQAPEFRAPIAWDEIEPAEFDGLVLAGGHAPGMRQYLASRALRDKVASFWALGRPVGAICHGVLVLARTTDLGTGRSVIADRTTTCLPKYMERTAFWLTAWKLGRYYRTYPAYVEDEVRDALSDQSLFVRGPWSPGRRGTAADDGPAFAVRDGNYVSARWPGDAYLFTSRFCEVLEAV
jgi:putative intracellular protease/amidase